MCALAKPLVQSRAVGLFATFSNIIYNTYVAAILSRDTQAFCPYLIHLEV